MADRYEVIFAGSGGQGLIMAGVLLAETGIYEGKNVVQSQTYGIASRGGFSKSEVIISSDEIVYQQVQNPDIVIALSEEAMKIYEDLADVTIIYDSDLVKSRDQKNWHGIPFTKTAFDLNNPESINIIVLGLMVQIKSMVQPDSLETVIDRKFKSNRNNLKALKKGMEMGNALREAMAKC